MQFLYFITGFFLNLGHMLIEMWSMSYDVGIICMTKNKFLWDIPELELLDQLGDDPYEDNKKG